MERKLPPITPVVDYWGHLNAQLRPDRECIGEGFDLSVCSLEYRVEPATARIRTVWNFMGKSARDAKRCVTGGICGSCR
jgi:hypothetical protein